MFAGDVLTFNETLTGSGFYTQALTCTDAADTNPVDGLTVSPNDTAITCLYTNTGRARLAVAKVSNGGTGTFTFTGTNGYPGDTLVTTIAGTTVSGTRSVLAANSTITTITEDATAGFAVSNIACTGLPAGGTATPNLGARSVTLDALATAAGADIVCTFTNSRLPTVSISANSLGDVGTFSYSGNNGYAPQSITTLTAGTPVAAPEEILAAEGVATTITQAAPPAGFALTDITCAGLAAGGNFTPNLATGSVTFDATATAAGAQIACTFTNTKRPTLQIAKQAVDNAGGETFSFTGNNGFGNDAISIAGPGGTASGAIKVLADSADTTITEAADGGFRVTDISCADQTGAVAITANFASRTVTIPAASLLPGAAVVCTYTNILPIPALDLVKTADATNVDSIGDQIPYSYAITNTGNVPLRGVTLTDDKIPNAASFSCNAALPATLAVNQTVTCTANYTVTQADVDAGEVVNTANAQDDAGVTDVDTEQVVLARAPALGLAKSANPTTFTEAGDEIDYTYVVTNTGNVTISAPISIADDKFPSGGIVCSTIADGQLSPLESVTCTGTYAVSQADVDAGSVTNQATATGVGPSGNVTSATVTATATTTRTQAIAVVKTAQQASFNATGVALGYTYALTNNGNTTLTNVGLVDDKIVAANISCTPGPLPVASLLPGQTIQCTGTHITGQTDLDAGGVTNIATATATGPLGPVSGSDSQTVPAVVGPALTVDKDAIAEPDNFDQVGDEIDYTYLVTNSGNQTISGPITVDDNFVLVSCPPGNLAPGATLQCTGTHTVTQDDLDIGSVTNVATTSGLSPNGTTITSNPDSFLYPAGSNPALSITKTPDVANYDAINDQIVYTYRVTNNGNVTFTTPINVVDDVLGTFQCAPGAPAGNLPPAASVTCTATHTVNQADLNSGSVVNNAQASAVYPALGGREIISASVQATVPAVQNPELTVVKSTTPALNYIDLNGNLRPDAGETISYTISVTNSGNVRLTNVDVEDPALGISNAILANVSPDLDNDPTTLDPGDSGSITRTYALTQADINAGQKVNSATAHSIDPNGVARNGNDSITVPLPTLPALTVDKEGTLITGPDGNAHVGDLVNYTFLVTNTGNVEITGIAIDDPLLNGSPGGVTCPLGVLEPGKVETCTASYALTQADIDLGQIDNTAAATGNDPAGGDVTSPTDSESVLLPTEPAVTLVKTAGAIDDLDGNGPDAGDTIAYNFTVTNTGNVTLTGVDVTDTMLGLIAVPVSPAVLQPNDIGVLGPVVYTLTQTDIDAGLVENNASVSATPPTGVDATDSDSTTTLIANDPELTLDKQPQAGATFAAAGDPINYTYLVTNNGNRTVTDPITVTDDKIANVTCDPLPVGGLAPTQTLACTGIYNVSQADVDAGSVTNVAQAVSGGTLSDPDNATVTGAGTLALTFVKEAAPGSTYAAAGDTINYSYEVTNTGTRTITAPISVSDDRIATADILCPPLPANGLAPGQALTCTGADAVDQADLDAGSVTNVATATDGTTSSPSATETVTATTAPALSVVKTFALTSGDGDAEAEVGEAVTFTVVVSNDGNVTLTTPAAPTDTLTTLAGDARALAAGLSFLSGTNGSTATTLTVGGSQTFTGTYVLVQDDIDDGGLNNLASTTGTPSVGGAPVPASGDVDVPAAPAAGAIALSKAAVLPLADTNTDGVAGGLGDEIAYTLVVANSGNVTLSNVTVGDPDAAVTGSPVASLAPGGSASLSAVHVIDQGDLDAGQVTNVATATGTTPGGATVSDASDDPANPANDDPDGDGNPDDATVTPVAPAAGAIALSKAAVLPLADTNTDGVAGGLGDEIAYTLVVTNSGNVTLSNVTVGDPDAAVTGSPVASLAPGGSASLSAVHVIDQGDLDAGQVTNVATATGTTPGGATVSDASDDPANPANDDPDGDGNPDDATVTPVAPAAGAIGLTKAAVLPLADTNTDGVAGGLGDEIAYTLVVTNSGNVTLSNVTVGDPDAAVTGSPVASLAPGGSASLSAVHVIDQGDLDAGQVTNVATATGTTPGGATVSDASDDPANPANDDPDGDGNPDDATVTPVAPAVAEIGAAKSAGAPSLNSDGTFDVTYTIRVKNTGNVNLTDLQLEDDLTQQSQLGSAFVSVSSPPTVTLSNTSGSSVAPTTNPGFGGNTAEPGMLEGTDGLLAPGDVYTVVFTVIVDPNADGRPDTLQNEAVASGEAPSGNRVSDNTDAGQDPDDNAGGPGTPTILLLPATPDTGVSIAKTAGVRLARRGDTISYAITVSNTNADAAGPYNVVDRLPSGFLYLEDSAQIEGVNVTPELSGRQITFQGVIVPGGSVAQPGTITITIKVRLSTSVQPGDHVNVAELLDPQTGQPVADAAQASVRVMIEHVFDCGEIIGKVFDDQNRNGYQDQDEPGLPGVRVATVRGLLITTDKHGRFSVPCADIPDARIGSNFIIKLDTRTLPTGYRLTTENPRVVRLTQGKVTKLNFGAAIDKIVRIDVNNSAFVAGSNAPSEKLRVGLEKVVDLMTGEHSVVRLTYYAKPGDAKLAQARLSALEKLLRRQWRAAGGPYELGIESKVVRK